MIKTFILIYLFIGLFEATMAFAQTLFEKNYTNIQTYIAGFILKVLLWPLAYIGAF
jgi:cell shape-determining protein MreD